MSKTVGDDQQAGYPRDLDSASAKQLKTVLDSQATASEPSLTGQGRYKIQRLLGQGGMGMVLSATDLVFGRDVAVKILHERRQTSNRDLLRFLEEAQVTGQLEHPNIVPVHELDCLVDGSIYYTMKQVRGDTLQDVVERLKKGDAQTIEQYPLNRLLDIFTQVCDAVAYAHSKNVIHRDIKPANIMLGPYGEVLVLDWGLSRVRNLPDLCSADEPVSSAAREEVPELTQEGSAFGTPGYAAPEQIRSADKADRCSDLYSLGAVLYSILTLQPPVVGKTVQQRLVQTLQGNVDKPEDRLGGTPLPHLPGGRVPPAVSAVAMRALERDVADRYDSVTSLRDEIRAYLSGFATTAEQAGPLRKLQLLRRRYPWESAISILAMLLLAMATAGTLMYLHKGRAKAADILARTKQLHAKAENSRKAKERHLADIRRSAGLIAEQSKISLESYRGRRVSYQSDNGKMFMWSPVVAVREIDSALTLEPDSASFWFQKGLTLETPEFRSPAKAGDPTEDEWKETALSWKLDEAAEALKKAIDLSSGNPELNHAARRELAKVDEFRALQTEKSKISPRVLPRLLNWLVLNGRQREAGLLRFPLAKMSASKLSARRGELTAAGLDYTPPGSWASPSLACCVKTSRLMKPDFSVLKGMILDQVEISYRGDVDLTPLRETALSRLSIYGAKVSDLSPLKGMALDWFGMQNAVASDLSPLDGMPLRTLRIYNSPVTKLPDLSGASLVELRISGTKITDLSPVAGMPLRRFHAHGTPVANLDALAGMPLEVVHFCESNVESLKPLANVSPYAILGSGSKVESLEGPRTDRLTEVRLSNTYLSDLSPLKGSKVRLLWVSNCPIKSIDPLKGVPLRDVRLDGTKIKEIGGLDGMDLRRLDISGCAVSDLNPIARSRIRFLDIDGTLITDMSQLVDLPKLLSLRIDAAQVPAFREVLPKLEELYRFAIDTGPWIIRRDFPKWLRNKPEGSKK